MRTAPLGLLALALAAGAIAIGCGDDPVAAGGGGDDDVGTSSSGESSSGASSSGGAGSSSSSGGSSSSSSSGGSSSSSGGPAAAPWLVQCFYGAAALGFDAANPDIEAACNTLSYDKVKTCAQPSCKTGWAFTATDDAYDALFDALDSNDDEAVDDSDAPRSIALLGHSWGGMNTVDVATKLKDDDRVSPSRKAIKLGMAWDPYKLNGELLPASNFERFIVLRHSMAADNDCSATIGPFYGYAPKCPAGQACEDYDYSKSPEVEFPAFPSGVIKGKNVEHCNNFNVGFPVSKAILDGIALPPLPQSIPVAAP